MRWFLNAALFFGLVCAVRSDDSDKPSLRIMVRSTLFNVNETRAIYCGAQNVEGPVQWFFPSGKLVEEQSTKNNRIYVQYKEDEKGPLTPLIMNNMSITDSGIWTCRAGNISETREFIVGEKAHIDDTDVSVEGEEGRSLKIPCEAQGHPTPVITWYKDKTQMDKEIQDKPRKYKIRADSLEIKDLNHLDVGTYICKATQKALSHYTQKTVHLTVQHKPLFFNPHNHEFYETYQNIYKTEEIYGIMNETKNISCGAIANPQPTYAWRRRVNSVDGDPITNPEMVVTDEDGSSVLILRLRDESDLGEYKCTANNTRGTVSIIFHVSIGSKPEPPSSVACIGANSSTLMFNVTCDECNFDIDEMLHDPKNLPILGYNFELVEAKKDFEPEWDEAVDIPVRISTWNDTIFAVGPLNNKTTYHVRVRSRNAAGYSEWIEVVPDPATTDSAFRLTPSTFIFSLLCTIIVEAVARG